MKADIVLKKELLKGKPGGYYVPDVDDNYNLTFTPTDKDMPLVDSTNLNTMLLGSFLETDEYESIAAAEAQRIEAENSRNAAETSRAAAETNRATAEYSRLTEEISRSNAEKARAAAEEERIAAEEERITNTSTALQSVEAATEAANNAISMLLDNAHADAITPTATGEIVSVNDAAEKPLKGLTIYGKTTQDGTPTPDSPVPLVSVGESGNIQVGVRGSNIVDWAQPTTKYKLESFTAAEDSSMIAVTGKSEYSYASYTLNHQALRGKTLHCSIEKYETVRTGIVTIQLIYKAQEGEPSYHSFMSTPKAIKIPDDVTSVVIQVVCNNTNTILEENNTLSIYKPMVVIGETSQVWEPYKDGGSVTLNTPNGLPGIAVNNGGNYTDSTGQQWIADEIDLERGVYVKRTHLLSNYTKTATLTNTDRYNYNSSYGFIGNSVVAALCTVMAQDKYNFSAADNAHFYADVRGGSAVFVPTGFDNSNNTIKMLVALATPIETALTAEEIAAYKALYSQHPNTTIYTDSNAGIAATYIADTKTYIDNKFEELTNAIISLGGNV